MLDTNNAHGDSEIATNSTKRKPYSLLEKRKREKEKETKDATKDRGIDPSAIHWQGKSRILS